MKKLKPIIAYAVVDKDIPTGLVMSKIYQYYIYCCKKDAIKAGWDIKGITKIIKIRITQI